MGHGKVYLVGGGPGDPKLITVRAVELLKEADVVIYDRLVGESILNLAPKKAEKIYVGKRTGKHEIPQNKITELIIEKAQLGGKVVRLKGGDPFIFGRGGEEAEALSERGIEFEVVPGVSSAVAAPTYAGIPLTHRDYAASVAIITGHRAGDSEQVVNWAKIADAVDTMVILMGVESLQAITEKLIEGGLNPETPAAIIESGTLKNQRAIIDKIGTLAKEAEEKQVKPPAVIVIGEVVNLGRKLTWFQKTPSLKGKTVAITRPAGQAEEAGKLIEEKGGVPYFMPAIEIRGLTNFSLIKKFVSELVKGQVDYVVFMSTNGVKYLFDAAKTLKQLSQLREGLAKTFVIAVGPRTAQALEEEYHVHVSLVPLKYSSEGLIECLQDKDISGKTMRIPRTTGATPTLTEKLREMGAQVEEVYVYESGLPVDKKLKDKFFKDLTSGKIDAIVFGSGLSAKNVFKMLTENAPIETLRALINSKVTTVAIGPTTAEALREMGIKVDVMPQDYLFEEALTALARQWECCSMFGSNRKLNSFSKQDETESHEL